MVDVEFTRDNARVLIEAIREDMAGNCNERRSLKERRIALGRDASQYVVPDPEVWQNQFGALVAAGYDDISIGYWRLSTSTQTDGFGADVQQRHIISWAVAQQVAGVVSERGIDMWVWDVDSGKEESRVGFDFVRRAAETGNVKNVVAYRHDRLARNQFFAELIQREFRKSYTKAHSATENLPGGALGDLMRQIIQAFAQYEAAVIAERLSRGKKEAIRRKGVYNGGEVPYGYLALGTRGDTGKGTLVVCESEARIIRLIFLLYERGYSQSAIGRALNRWAVPTRHRGALGWRQGQIRRILRAEAQYRGEALFSRGITDFEIVAHAPILERRPEEADRSYLFGRKSPLKSGAQVPDDVFGSPVSQAPRRNSRHCLTASQARMLQVMFTLLDQGTRRIEILQRLNELGLYSLEGRPWTPTNLGLYIKRRHLFEAQIEAQGLADPSESPDPPQSQEKVRVELEAVAQIRSLRAEGMSIAKIVAVLKARGYVTRNGCQWYPSTVDRVLKGFARNTERAPESGLPLARQEPSN